MPTKPLNIISDIFFNIFYPGDYDVYYYDL